MFKQTILIQSLHTIFLKEKSIVELNIVVLYFFKIRLERTTQRYMGELEIGSFIKKKDRLIIF